MAENMWFYVIIGITVYCIIILMWLIFAGRKENEESFIITVDKGGKNGDMSCIMVFNKCDDIIEVIPDADPESIKDLINKYRRYGIVEVIEGAD